MKHIKIEIEEEGRKIIINIPSTSIPQQPKKSFWDNFKLVIDLATSIVKFIKEYWPLFGLALSWLFG